MAVQWFWKLPTAKLREFRSAANQFLCTYVSEPTDTRINREILGAIRIDVKGKVFNLMTVPFWNWLGAHMRKYTETSNYAICSPCCVRFISVRFAICRTSTFCTVLSLRCVEITGSLQHKICSDYLKLGSRLWLSGKHTANTRMSFSSQSLISVDTVKNLLCSVTSVD